MVRNVLQPFFFQSSKKKLLILYQLKYAKIIIIRRANKNVEKYFHRIFYEHFNPNC